MSYKLEGFVDEQSLWDWLLGKADEPTVDLVELKDSTDE